MEDLSMALRGVRRPDLVLQHRGWLMGPCEGLVSIPAHRADEAAVLRCDTKKQAKEVPMIHELLGRRAMSGKEQLQEHSQG